jgi:hypothetical protein
LVVESQRCQAMADPRLLRELPARVERKASTVRGSAGGNDQRE